MDGDDYFDTNTTIAQTQPTFMTNITYDQITDAAIGVQHQIGISTMYKSTPGTNGTMQWRNCTLREALVRYPIHIINTTVTLRDMDPLENRTDQLIRRGYESAGMSSMFSHSLCTIRYLQHVQPADEPTDTPSTLGGLARALQAQYTANASMSWIGGWSTVRVADTVSSLYLRTPNISAMTTNDITWADPIDDAIAMLQELTLRTAITTTSQTPELSGYSAPIAAYLTATQPEVISPNLTAINRTLTQDATARMTHPETVYRAHSDWLGGGFAVIVLACISIIPTYRGWWNLPRNVSMSPLEVARAFDAPLLRSSDPNGEVRDLLRASGSKSVRYEGGVAAPIMVGEHDDNLSKELGVARSVSDASAFGESANSSSIGLVTLRGRQQGNVVYSERGDSLGFNKF